MTDELEIVARQDAPAEITANVEGEANISAAVEAPAEIRAEVEIAGPQGPKGEKGDTGPGVPDGGAAGTLLEKVSATNQDTAWRQPRLHFGKVDTTSTSTAFTATVPGVTALEDGVTVQRMLQGIYDSARLGREVEI